MRKPRLISGAPCDTLCSEAHPALGAATQHEPRDSTQSGWCGDHRRRAGSRKSPQQATAVQRTFLHQPSPRDRRRRRARM